MLLLIIIKQDVLGSLRRLGGIVIAILFTCIGLIPILRGFLFPKAMLKDGLNMNDAAYKAGMTKDLNGGSAEGLVGVVTKGRLTRKEYTKESITRELVNDSVCALFCK